MVERLRSVRHPIPDLHERGRGRRHDPDAGGLPRQRRRAARPGLHRRLRPGRRRHLRSGRPHDRLAVAPPRTRSGSPNTSSRLPPASPSPACSRCSSTSPATAPSPPTVTSACRCSPAHAPSSTGSTSCRSARLSRRVHPRSWSATSTYARSTRACRPLSRARWSPTCCARSWASSGLVVTDALDMAGVTRGRDPGRTAVQALRAGSDVLLMPPSPAVARTALIRAVKSGTLPRRRLEQAAARQIALLRHLAGTSGAPIGSARAASQRLSAQAVTVVSGACSGRLVADSVHAYGDAGAVGAFTAAAARAGLHGAGTTRGAGEADVGTSRSPSAARRSASLPSASASGPGRRPRSVRVRQARRLDRSRGRATLRRHPDRVQRVPRRTRRRRHRCGDRQPVGARPGRRTHPHRDVRRHLGRHEHPGRGRPRPGRGARSAAGLRRRRRAPRLP